MRYYLAARYGRRAELCEYKRALEAAGHVVTARWLLHPEYDAIDKTMTVPQMRQFAFHDLEDIEEADCLIAFTEASTAGYSRGGRHVEMGYALALCKRIVVIGPIENIFYAFPHIDQFCTWEHYYASIPLV